ncbi:MAG: hypothetical protein IJK18_08480 [Clostridia bacterium]|nr:hypothetical protein [Clostridia bacterium]
MDDYMNKKSIILVGMLFGIIIIGLIVYLVLSLTTDIFKPASEMFNTYLKEDISKINQITDLSKEKDYLNTLTQSNFRENIKADFKYTNSQEMQEKFSIISSGITNNLEKNSYKAINIKYGDNLDIMDLEYLQENQTYGLLFANVVKQFVSADVESYSDLLDMLGIDKTNLEKYKVLEKWDLIANQKEKIENVIASYIKDTSNARFKKQKSSQVTLNNGEEKTANVYSLTLSKDETKELYIEILKGLGKQAEINDINTTKKQFTETKIFIYVADNKTIRISVEVENKQAKIDFSENRLSIKYNDITEEEIKTKSIDIKQEEQNKSIEYSDSYNNKISLVYILGEDINQKKLNLKLNAQNDYIKGVEFNLAQNLETSNSALEGIQKKLENQANINITNLKVSERNTALNGLLQRIDRVLIKKNNQINSEVLKMWININKTLEQKYQGIKEKQKQIFNNQFITYKGQNVKKEIIYNLLDLAGRNMKNYKTIGESSFEINISEGKQNIELAQEIIKAIKESDNNFNIDFGYDSDGKLNLIKIQGYKER